MNYGSQLEVCIRTTWELRENNHGNTLPILRDSEAPKLKKFFQVILMHILNRELYTQQYSTNYS